MTFRSSQVSRDAALIRRFGESVRYTVPGEATITVSAVFDDPTRQSQVGQRSVAARFPMISCLKTEVVNMRKGDTFEVGGIDYRVKKPNTDIGEIVSAELERVSA